MHSPFEPEPVMKHNPSDFRLEATMLRSLMSVLCFSLLCGTFAGADEWSAEKLLASVMIEDLVKAKPTPTKAANTASLSSPEQAASTVTQSDSEPKPAHLLNERSVLGELRHQLASHFSLQEDFRIYFDKPWRDLNLEHPHWELVVTSFPPQGLRSRFYLSFEIWVAGKRHSTWQESVRCELWTDAYVATQRLDRGSRLHSDLVTVKPVDRLSLYQGVVEPGTKLDDYLLNNGVKAGEPLFWNDLKERPLIEKNALIDVVAEEGALKVTLKAKALETGVKGQIIRIRNLQSFNDIQAEVIGVNQAKVYF